VGATSTRSRSDSWARRRASWTETIPTCSPLGPTSRTSGTRIRSLMRGSALMGPLPSFLGLPGTGRPVGGPLGRRPPSGVPVDRVGVPVKRENPASECKRGVPTGIFRHGPTWWSNTGLTGGAHDVGPVSTGRNPLGRHPVGGRNTSACASGALDTHRTKSLFTNIPGLGGARDTQFRGSRDRRSSSAQPADRMASTGTSSRPVIRRTWATAWCSSIGNPPTTRPPRPATARAASVGQGA